MIKRIRQWLSHLRIQRKISWGYGLSLGIAITGTSFGIVLADQQQHQAELLQQDVIEELTLITRLQVDVLQTLTEQQHVREWIANPEHFQQHYEDLQRSHQRFRQSWEQFKFAEGGTKDQEEIELEGEIEAVTNFLTKYEGVPEAYLSELDRLLPQADATILSPEELIRLRTGLTQLERSTFVEQMDEFAEELTALRNSVTQEDYENAEQAIRMSSTLRIWVITISMAGSVAIAAILSLFTSRAIAHPLQLLTQVTQKALNESNFDLQAPVMTQDEVGTLAVSFNRLIASVKKLLDQQQEYNSSLEKKVAERTQELSDKNIQLQELLEKLHQTQLQIVQSEKMSSLGELVAGIAHEINNPVNFIHANINYLREYIFNLLTLIQLYPKHYPVPMAEIAMKVEDMDLDFVQQDLPKLLGSMQIGTERICDIVIALRNFSRIDEAESKAVDIHEGIDSTLLILQHRFKAKTDRPEIRVIRNYGKLPLIECYPGQLNQVLMNILANAIDAIEEARTQQKLTESSHYPCQIEICTTVLDPQWVAITITDNGSGIPEAIQNRIFNPFFTTKPVGKGTGMGMAISYQIVTEKHKGKLECSSIVGKGTTFKIQIPVKQSV